jgi:hypothetical protein
MIECGPGQSRTVDRVRSDGESNWPSVRIRRTDVRPISIRRAISE